jgi:hypothetical protein
MYFHNNSAQMAVLAAAQLVMTLAKIANHLQFSAKWILQNLCSK